MDDWQLQDKIFTNPKWACERIRKGDKAIDALWRIRIFLDKRNCSTEIREQWSKAIDEIDEVLNERR